MFEKIVQPKDSSGVCQMRQIVCVKDSFLAQLQDCNHFIIRRITVQNIAWELLCTFIFRGPTCISRGHLIPMTALGDQLCSYTEIFGEPDIIYSYLWKNGPRSACEHCSASALHGVQRTNAVRVSLNCRVESCTV